MPSRRQSDIFKKNFVCWNVFGLWPGRKKSKYYKYYSFLYLFVTLFVYNFLLTINLVYTPLKIELMIQEVIFYFTEIAVMAKALMILNMRSKIIEAFNLLDSADMEGDDDKSKQTINRNYTGYQTYWKIYVVISNAGYLCQIFLPIFLHFIFKTNLELPVCKYYFLTDEMRENYFVLWFIYQSFGIYGHMMYNASVDTFIAGLLLLAITQCKVISNMFYDMKFTAEEENKLNTEVQEQIQTARLKKCLRRYDFFLIYCDAVQKILDVTMFVQFGMSCTIICAVMCGFLLSSSKGGYILMMMMYILAMTLQIFIPAYLGTQLSYESQALVFAAYNSEWVPRSESFKRSIRIFVERANMPIQMSGLKVLPFSLTTFTSIMKSAYSFFTLIRNFQNK